MAHERMHKASARAVYVLELVSTAESRTETLYILLLVSINHHTVVSCREVECLPRGVIGSVVLGLAVSSEHTLFCSC